MYKNCELINTSMGSCSKSTLLVTRFYEVSMAAAHRLGKSRRWRDGDAFYDLCPSGFEVPGRRYGLGEIIGAFRFWEPCGSFKHQNPIKKLPPRDDFVTH
ncbi:MAG: hypothetical protein IPM03_10490 [Sulfuritalea sp.]|jgi:hypothetical protein|nr:hypothetical protein [Sulfuritalea sp.]